MAIFREKTNIWRGVATSVVVQWFVLMQLVYSPIIGWGVFGSAAGTLPAGDPLALTSMGRYIAMTLILHIVYGALNGWLIPRWVTAAR